MAIERAPQNKAITTADQKHRHQWSAVITDEYGDKHLRCLTCDQIYELG